MILSSPLSSLICRFLNCYLHRIHRLFNTNEYKSYENERIISSIFGIKHINRFKECDFIQLFEFTSLKHLLVYEYTMDSFLATINSQASIAETSCLHLTPSGILMCSIQKDHTFSAYTQFRLVLL